MMNVPAASLARLLRERWDVVHAWEEPYVACGFQVAALTREFPVYR